MRVLDDWLLTAERIAFHIPTATAVVADLHLGYAEARRRNGDAVPGDSLDEQLFDLRRAMQRHQARRLVVAGDLLEDGRCHTVGAAIRDWLDKADIELVALVHGNHDLKGEPLSSTRSDFVLGQWSVVHGDGPIPDGPVIHGHEHPCIRWSPTVRASGIEAVCYLVGTQRLILPAYSRESAGVNVLSMRRWRSYRAMAIAGDRVLDLGELATFRTRMNTVGFAATHSGALPRSAVRRG